MPSLSDLQSAGLNLVNMNGRYFTTDQQGANREILGANDQTFQNLGIDPSQITKAPNYTWHTSGANLTADQLGGFYQQQLGDINTLKNLAISNAQTMANNAAMNAANPSNTVDKSAGQPVGMGGLDANGNVITRQPDPALAAKTNAQLPTLANGQQAGSSLSQGLQMPANASNLVYDPISGKQVSPSEAAFNATQASGKTAPQTAGEASPQVQAAVNNVTPSNNAAYVSHIQQTLNNDPGWQQLLSDAKNIQAVSTQHETLTQQYQDLLNQYNIPEINTQLVNMQNVINGTEDDIRKEVVAAGGFATDSQVLALASARNKTLITNYNNLLQTKADAMQQIQTISGLEAQDRQNAIAVANNQLQIDSQLADYQQKFQANAQQAYNNVISAVGYVGLYQALGNDPSSITLAEQTLGLAPGELQGLAQQQYAQQQAAQQAAQTDLALKQTQLAQAQQTLNLNAAEEPLKVKQLQSQINASNASAASSAASTQKIQADIAFMNSHNGMSPTEYDAYIKDQNDQEHTFDTNAANLIGQMVSKQIDWNTAWNQLHASYPNLSVQTIDNALNATQYRSKYGG